MTTPATSPTPDNVIDLQQRRRRFDAQTRHKMRRFLNDELTWAQVEGMSFEEAERIARLGCELAGQGRLHEARVIFEGLVAGNPEDTSAQAALGTVYQRLNLTEDATACYDRALALFADNVVALAHRGELRLRAADKRGIEDLARAARIDSGGVSRAGRRARALLRFLLERTEAKRGPQAKARGR